MIRETSRLAYLKIQNRIAPLHRQICECLIDNNNEPLTRNQIEQITGIRINNVSGRVNKLLSLGILIELDEKVKCPISKHYCKPVMLAEDLEYKVDDKGQLMFA